MSVCVYLARSSLCSVFAVAVGVGAFSLLVLIFISLVAFCLLRVFQLSVITHLFYCYPVVMVLGRRRIHPLFLEFKIPRAVNSWSFLSLFPLPMSDRRLEALELSSCPYV